jgi:L-threonylcarbamoyladenylate synthase
LPPYLTAQLADLQRAAELLRQGECVALPTETVYGLAADALNEKAVAKIFTIKGRPLVDPLIVHVLDLAALATIAEPDERLSKIASCWPGPLTVVLRRKSHVPDLVTAGQNTVAVRLPSHPLFREVLQRSGCPLAAPSANPFGYISPTQAGHVRSSLAERCPWIVDGGPCEHGLESTILDLSQSGRIRLLRPGPITMEMLQAKLGSIEVLQRAGSEQQAQLAPGMLERHYSPRTAVKLFSPGTQPQAEAGAAVVFLQRPATVLPHVFYLAEQGGVASAAPHLFALLRQLDERGYSKIYVELASPEGLGLAYNDRLTRAAAR